MSLRVHLRVLAIVLSHQTDFQRHLSSVSNQLVWVCLNTKTQVILKWILIILLLTFPRFPKMFPKILCLWVGDKCLHFRCLGRRCLCRLCSRVIKDRFITLWLTILKWWCSNHQLLHQLLLKTSNNHSSKTFLKAMRLLIRYQLPLWSKLLWWHIRLQWWTLRNSTQVICLNLKPSIKLPQNPSLKLNQNSPEKKRSRILGWRDSLPSL